MYAQFSDLWIYLQSNGFINLELGDPLWISHAFCFKSRTPKHRSNENFTRVKTFWQSNIAMEHETYSYGGFHKSWGYPQLAGWFLLGKVPLKWMIRGYPYFRKPSICSQVTIGEKSRLLCSLDVNSGIKVSVLMRIHQRLR